MNNYIFDYGLLEDFMELGNKLEEEVKGAKAQRLWIKAMKRGKVDLANRVKEKYGRLFPRPSDLAIASMYAILAMKGAKE